MTNLWTYKPTGTLAAQMFVRGVNARALRFDRRDEPFRTFVRMLVLEGVPDTLDLDSVGDFTSFFVTRKDAHPLFSFRAYTENEGKCGGGALSLCTAATG